MRSPSTSLVSQVSWSTANHAVLAAGKQNSNSQAARSLRATAKCRATRSRPNFNPLAAMCDRVILAEVEELVEPAEPGERIHTRGVGSAPSRGAR